MEETSQQDVEYRNPNDDQGGIRRRLRDRDVLRKKKAEAEEKETNQMESPRKRSRADKGSSKRRGRPRKSEAAPLIAVIQEEAAVTEGAPEVVVVPDPAEVILDQTPNPSLTSVTEAEPAPVLEFVQRPIFGTFQSPVSAPIITSALVNKVLDPAPIQNSAPAPDTVSVPALSQDSVPAAVPAPPPAPPQVEDLFTELQSKEAPDQILIEDLGPDEEEDIPPSQNKGADEDVTETLRINMPEQTKMYSVPTVSCPPVSQEYFPGN